MSSIYLHIPYCSQKCPYCDFYSQPGSNDQIAEYVGLLKQHIDVLAAEYPETHQLTTIFFGGGTPSLLSPSQVTQILSKLDSCYGIASDAEITLEANPGTISLTKLQGYRQAGVNRLSFGVQSLNNKNLQFLGRIHNREEALKSYNYARQAGFDNISLDLIFALPGQSLEENATEVESLLNLNPEHLSLYGLSYEPGTPFAAQVSTGEIVPCSDEIYERQYRQIHQLMLNYNYEHYEISNFSRPGKRCHHNQIYWQRKNCLAAGCGAHGFDEGHWGRRWSVPTDIKQVTNDLLNNKNPAETLETFDQQSAMSEYCYLRLRTSDGLDIKEFNQIFNADVRQVFGQALRRCQKYLLADPKKIRFNLDGWLIYDHLISEFL